MPTLRDTVGRYLGDLGIPTNQVSSTTSKMMHLVLLTALGLGIYATSSRGIVLIVSVCSSIDILWGTCGAPARNHLNPSYILYLLSLWL